MDKIGKLLRILGLAAVVGLLVALFIFNPPGKQTAASKVWDEHFTVGSLDAKNHYIMYTDLMCPYCDVFARQLMEHDEEFQRDYIEGQNILFEVRLTDFLYEYGAHQTEYSRQSAEAAYCAAREDRFWDFYHAALKQLWDDYHSKGIGTSKTAPEITGITDAYWLKIGQKLGLGAEFEQCYNDHATVDTIKANTAKAAQVVGGGVPYFKFNSFENGGFDPSWGWDYVKQYLDAGLRKS